MIAKITKVFASKKENEKEKIVNMDFNIYLEEK